MKSLYPVVAPTAPPADAMTTPRPPTDDEERARAHRADAITAVDWVVKQATADGIQLADVAKRVGLTVEANLRESQANFNGMRELFEKLEKVASGLSGGGSRVEVLDYVASEFTAIFDDLEEAVEASGLASDVKDRTRIQYRMIRQAHTSRMTVALQAMIRKETTRDLELAWLTKSGKVELVNLQDRDVEMNARVHNILAEGLGQTAEAGRAIRVAASEAQVAIAKPGVGYARVSAPAPASEAESKVRSKVWVEGFLVGIQVMYLALVIGGLCAPRRSSGGGGGGETKET